MKFDADRALLDALDLDALGPTAMTSRFTVPTLRRFCRELGLPAGGRKAELALRLCRRLKRTAGEMKVEDRQRDSEGKFTYKLERVCVCGHACGEHTAVRVKDPFAKGKWLQPCTVCDCEVFTLKRRGR